MYKTLKVLFRKKIDTIEEYVEGRCREIGVERNYSKEARAFIHDFSEKYKKNRKAIKGDVFAGCFEFSSKRVSFEEIFAQLLPLEHEIEFVMYISTVYEKKDFDSAAAYMIFFPKECFYYDDCDEEEFNSIEILCEERNCFARGHRDKIYVKPNNGLKKRFTQEYTGASTMRELHIVSEKMMTYLLENGISERYFGPVYEKKGTLWAYYLKPGNIALPSLSILNDQEDWLHVCPTCGRNIIYMSHQPKGDSLWNAFQDANNFGEYPASDRWEISREVLKNLEAVNITADYFTSCQYIVINRQLFELLQQKIPRLGRTSVPVFAADFQVRLEDHKIIREHKV